MRKPDLISSVTTMREGTTNKINNVAMPNPNTMVIAIGIRNCACILRSNIRGVNPPIVVIEVRMIGLNLSHDAPIIASKSVSDFIRWSTVVANIIEPFITIPDKPTKPIKLKMVRL